MIDGDKAELTFFFASRTVRPAYEDEPDCTCQSLRAFSFLDVLVSHRVMSSDGSNSGPLICMASAI